MVQTQRLSDSQANSHLKLYSGATTNSLSRPSKSKSGKDIPKPPNTPYQSYQNHVPKAKRTVHDAGKALKKALTTINLIIPGREVLEPGRLHVHSSSAAKKHSKQISSVSFGTNNRSAQHHKVGRKSLQKQPRRISSSKKSTTKAKPSQSLPSNFKGDDEISGFLTEKSKPPIPKIVFGSALQAKSAKHPTPEDSVDLETSSKIRVCVRLRPLLPQEQNAQVIWDTFEKQI